MVNKGIAAITIRREENKGRFDEEVGYLYFFEPVEDGTTSEMRFPFFDSQSSKENAADQIKVMLGDRFQGTVVYIRDEKPPIKCVDGGFSVGFEKEDKLFVGELTELQSERHDG